MVIYKSQVMSQVMLFMTLLVTSLVTYKNLLISKLNNI